MLREIFRITIKNIKLIGFVVLLDLVSRVAREFKANQDAGMYDKGFDIEDYETTYETADDDNKNHSETTDKKETLVSKIKDLFNRN